MEAKLNKIVSNLKDNGAKPNEISILTFKSKKGTALKNVSNISNYLEENLSHFRFDHIAAGLQSFTEKILLEWFSNALSEYDSSNVVFSGGV